VEERTHRYTSGCAAFRHALRPVQYVRSTICGFPAAGTQQ
jgi:hypothetical protein